MPRIEVLPHESLCPEGKLIDAVTGANLAQVLLDVGIDLEHACGLVCACTTCHVIVQEGFASLEPASEAEEDMLDKAWGLCSQSRLACQARLGLEDLLIEVPKYTLNLVSEGH